MTRETLLVLKGLLERVTISAGQDDFHETYRVVARAKAELDEALASADSDS